MKRDRDGGDEEHDVVVDGTHGTLIDLSIVPIVTKTSHIPAAMSPTGSAAMAHLPDCQDQSEDCSN